MAAWLTIMRVPLMQIAVPLACLSCIPPAATAQTQDESRLQAFDHIVTDRMIRSGFKQDVHLIRTVSAKDGIKGYSYSYKFKPRKRTEYYICSVSVGRSGAFLNGDRWQQDYATAATEYADRGEKYLLFQFPKIGSRARREPVMAGPNGSFTGVAFTTADGEFDVKVSAGSLLPDSVPDPGFDVDAVALKISELYDASR